MPFPTSKCGRPGGRPVRVWGRGARRRRNKGLREGSTTPDWRNSRLSLGAWCSSTKGQGFAGDEAPRRIGGRTVRAWGRGARRRRDKGLRGEKHHAEPEELAFEPEGVVLVDERTRVCGERSTTPSRRNSRLGLRAWCPSTKEQGFAGREAPRRTGGRDIRVALPVRPGPAPLRRRMASKSGAATAAPRHHNPFR